MTFDEMVYVKNKTQYKTTKEIEPNDVVCKISGTEFRNLLHTGSEIPQWFSYPEIVSELRKTHPPKHQQGITLFFTGLSGSGKSTLANALISKLMERSNRTISLLDGDEVRQNLSRELSFSKEHRDLHILRLGYVASEITKHRGIVICAAIAPYQATREKVRQMVSEHGGFIEIYLSTPLEVCENRDRKGLYAKARAGILKEFTGIDDPYEIPVSPELIINTTDINTENAIQKILLKLTDLGYLCEEISS